MRLVLIIILIFVGTAQCAVPTYGLQPSEGNYSEEKQKIAESVMPAREARESNLHPFVQPAVVGEGFKPSPTTENIRLRESPYRDSRSRIEVRNPEPKRGINFLFFYLILAAFLLSYFFIRPKSK